MNIFLCFYRIPMITHSPGHRALGSHSPSRLHSTVVAMPPDSCLHVTLTAAPVCLLVLLITRPSQVGRGGHLMAETNKRNAMDGWKDADKVIFEKPNPLYSLSQNYRSCDHPVSERIERLASDTITGRLVWKMQWNNDLSKYQTLMPAKW